MRAGNTGGCGSSFDSMKEMQQTRRKQGNNTNESTRNPNAIVLAFPTVWQAKHEE